MSDCNRSEVLLRRKYYLLRSRFDKNTPFARDISS